MPVCLLASTVFSEAVWQRVWAAQSANELKTGGMVGAVAVIIAVFLFGFAGFVAAWGGLIDVEQDNPNLYLFQLLKAHAGDTAHVDSWPSVVVLVLASTMSEGAIDSLQNGILGGLHSLLPTESSLCVHRVLLVAMSAVLVLIALYDFPVLEIFLVTNMLCTCSFLPFLLGALESEVARAAITEGSLLLSIFASVLAVCVCGVVEQWGQVQGRGVLGNVVAGLRFAWMGNGYSMSYFGVAAGTSVLVLGASALCTLYLLPSRHFPDKRTGGGTTAAQALDSLSGKEEHPEMRLLHTHNHELQDTGALCSSSPPTCVFSEARASSSGALH